MKGGRDRAGEGRSGCLEERDARPGLWLPKWSMEGAEEGESGLVCWGAMTCNPSPTEAEAGGSLGCSGQPD